MDMSTNGPMGGNQTEMTVSTNTDTMTEGSNNEAMTVPMETNTIPVNQEAILRQQTSLEVE
jgi:hypothetical protein